ncbi:MAG: hypothetical protein PUP92_17615 [Rhizonema sp. PD38]|nr:hypothetical protein [Rhizonema sp. PD38]
MSEYTIEDIIIARFLLWAEEGITLHTTPLDEYVADPNCYSGKCHFSRKFEVEDQRLHGWEKPGQNGITFLHEYS